MHEALACHMPAGYGGRSRIGIEDVVTPGAPQLCERDARAVIEAVPVQ
jgi:hypothetical protein